MKRVLAIDGGGIRGIIPAHFCTELENKSGKRIYELFDLIAGTSTGGIIALGLVTPSEGNKPLSAEKLVNLYKNHGKNIFSHPKNFVQNWSQPKYNPQALENALNEYFQNTHLSDAIKDVMVTTYDVVQRRPRILKSWETKAGDQTDGLIKDVARATSAAPTYFPLKFINYWALVDGGLFANNPAAVAYVEAKQRWPDEEIVLVSLGTGLVVREIYQQEDIKNWGIHGWANILLNCVFEGISFITDDIMNRIVEQENYYYRFDVSIPEGCEPLDDTEHIDALLTCARTLVDDSYRNNRIPKVVDLLKSKRSFQDPKKSGTLVLLSKDTYDSEKSQIIREAVSKPMGDIEPLWEFCEIETLQELADCDNLSKWKGIFLAFPYRQYFKPQLISRLVRWVREDGGKLVVTGFELGERHHSTNLNELTYHFGISFNSDVIVDRPPRSKQHENAYKAYGKALLYKCFANPKNHLLQNVSKIVARNACSLYLEPGSIPLVYVGCDNQIRNLNLATKDIFYTLSDHHYTLVTPYQSFFDIEDPYRAFVALAPKTLTGKGSVLAIGTWDFLPNNETNHDNEVFLQNIWHWMATTPDVANS
jgi:patatin-like phospholipase/acyl hydrolase